MLKYVADDGEKTHWLTIIQKSGQAPDILSWSTKNGRINPFEEELITNHFGMRDLEKIHVLDMELGTWVTHLRTSPPVFVTANSIIHMKNWDTVLDVTAAIAATQAKRIAFFSKRKPDSVDGSVEFIDLTTSDKPPRKKAKVVVQTEHEITPPINDTHTPSSPTQTHVSMEDIDDIGSRPARLSTFPARTVGQMVPRIVWIVGQDATPDTVESRFAKVFSCAYKKSTYYRHQCAWRWLRDNGILDESKDSDLWGPLVRAALVALKDEKVMEAKDLSPTKRRESVEL